MRSKDLTRVGALFDSVPLISSDQFITSENGVSAKSWYPLDNKELEVKDWLCNEISVKLYSTGLCKLVFSTKARHKEYNWMFRVLDEHSTVLFQMEFPPILVEVSGENNFKLFNQQRRFDGIHSDLIDRAQYIQVINR